MNCDVEFFECALTADVASRNIDSMFLTCILYWFLESFFLVNNAVTMKCGRIQIFKKNILVFDMQICYCCLKNLYVSWF